MKKDTRGIIAAGLLGIAATAALVFGIWNLLPLFGEPAGDTPLTLYEGAKTMGDSLHAKISANGNNLFVYDTVVNHSRENRGDYDVSALALTPMTYFDADFAAGGVDLDVEMINETDLPEITSASVSPLSHGITPKIKGRHITFKVTQAGSYTVQFNGSPHRAVHIFVNDVESDVPDRNDPNVVWIEPGEWNIPDGIQLQSNQTLYISGGAVVHTTVSAQFAENVTIRGRGMIDGGIWDSWQGTNAHVPVDFRYCKGVNVEGIILNNSNAWVFNMFETENGDVKNVKIISARPNGDGFTLQSCRNITVQNSFVRTWDDSCVVKNYEGNTDNITFNNMVVWTDLAQSLEIGYETNKGQQPDSVISNINFTNITVINAFHKPVMSIHNSDDALVENVTYKNITVENAAMGGGDAGENRQLIDLTIAPSTWNSTKERGTIRNVSFEDITVLGGTRVPPIRVSGYDEEHDIRGVTIKNLTLLGTKITKLEDLTLTSKYASDIVLEG
ncbi:hypothetical protein FACS189425_01250 [Clostridia bacterium]|nr:hypothetical protein FACS189425_01250 [Clostridia bacterium]